MSTPHDLSSLIKRRRAMAITSTALTLAGCGTLPSSSADSSQRLIVDAKVKAYASDIELALDNVDRERLRAAQKKTAPAPAPANASDLAVATLASPPAAANLASALPAPAPIPAPSQASVILASAGGDTGTSVHDTRTAIPETHTAPITETTEIAKPTVVKPTSVGTIVIPGTGAQVKAPEKAIAPAPLAPAPTVDEKPEPKTKTGTVTVETSLPAADNSAAPAAVISPVAMPTSSRVSAMGEMSAVASIQMPSAPAVLTALAVTGAPDTAAQPSVDDAIAVLKKNVGAHPTLSTSLALALLDGANAPDAAKGLSESDQKVFNDLLGALETMKTAAPGATLADRTAPLVDAAKKWQADADLSLPRLVLASRVDSFGVFTAIDPIFEQGKRHTVIIYCEVANFGSQKGTDGWYSTHLSQRETLMTDDKLLVWRPNAEDVDDRSLNQRHDFYLVKKLTIPENLAAGKYFLEMNVTDKIRNRNTIVTLPIEIK